jgi:hypothetical protein
MAKRSKKTLPTTRQITLLSGTWLAFTVRNKDTFFTGHLNYKNSQRRPFLGT